jgi:glycosyltransferase 2 family protein
MTRETKPRNQNLKKLLNILKNIAFLAIGIFLFWLVYRNFNFEDIGNQLSRINYWFILLAFVAGVVSHWSRGARWGMLIKPLGYKVSNFNAFLAVMIGYFANIGVPRLGEVSRCLVLNRTNKIGVDKLIGTVIVERLVDVISLLLILVLTLILQFSKISGFFVDFYHRTINSNPAANGRLFTTSILIIVLATVIVLVITVILLYRKLKDHRIVSKLRGMISGFKAGFRTIGQLENLGLFIFHSVLIWSMYYLMVYTCFFALPATAGLGPVIALVVLCMGSFGFVAPVPGGVGAYHAIVIQTLLLYGLNPQDSKTFALVAHTFQEAIIVLLGGLSFIYFSIYFKKLKSDDSSESNPAKAVS